MIHIAVIVIIPIVVCVMKTYVIWCIKCLHVIINISVIVEPVNMPKILYCWKVYGWRRFWVLYWIFSNVKPIELIVPHYSGITIRDAIGTCKLVAMSSIQWCYVHLYVFHNFGEIVPYIKSKWKFSRGWILI